MLDNLFKGIFDSEFATVISVSDFLSCLGVALLLGVILAVAYTFKARFTKSFATTLALLPAVVCVVIMMVNGNIGTGVAVAGAFSLVRFRSAPGAAREIVAIFLAMGAGLICGMGYLGYAALFTLIMCLLLAAYNYLDLGMTRRMSVHKSLRITIPEDLDYSGVFDEVFEKYTFSHDLLRVKTTNMGSMFRLTYNIALKDCAKGKEMIDELRCRNGNLEISVSKQETVSVEL